MFSRPFAFALLTAGCMTAAAGGAFVAMRQDGPPRAEAQGAAYQADPAQTLVSDASLPVATDGSTAPADGSVLVVPPAGAPAQVVEYVVQPRATESKPVPRRRVATRTRDTRTSAAREAAPASTPADATPAPPLESVEPAPTPAEAPVEPAPQLPKFDEIAVPAETVIGAQVDTTVTSERARVEDQMQGHVTRDVTVGGRVAIPAGTKLLGSVTLVERGGKFKERARIAVRFHTAQMPDGTRVPLQTTAIMREGNSPSRESAAKVGGSAVGGAILGAILGGTKGAVIGGTAGAAGGTAVVAAGDRNAATLPAGSTVSVRLMSDVKITVER